MLLPRAAARVGSELAGTYQLKRILGQGGMTATEYERPLALDSSRGTALEWVPFSVTAREPHTGKVREVRIESSNRSGDSTGFVVDSMSLRAKICPAQ